MSTLKVDTIESKTINGDITVSSPLVGDGSGLTGVAPTKATVEALGIDVPAANLTGSIAGARLPDPLPAISGASLTGVGVGKNIVINGAMQVAQRGTSFAAIANGAYSLDRWQFYNNIGVHTVTQDSNGPAGFANSLKIDCTTADASPAASEYVVLYSQFEGQDLQGWKKGTASAESVTVSFWVKCNKTGDIQVNIKDSDNARLIGNTVTINSADTWEQKSLTFVGDTTGAFDDDNVASLILEMWFDAGADSASGTIPTSWTTFAQADRAVGVTLALADSTSNYINITGVKLELGSVATDYEHKSYGEELRNCQRYYERHIATSAYGEFGNGYVETTSSAYINVRMDVEKRTTPTYAGSNLRVVNQGQAMSVTGGGINQASKRLVKLLLTGGASLTVRAACQASGNNDANAYMEFNAEL